MLACMMNFKDSYVPIILKKIVNYNCLLRLKHIFYPICYNIGQKNRPCDA